MNTAAVRLFDWIQHATFYEDAHREAVAALPPGAGRAWLDVGCGPGLLTRLAGAHGYVVSGIDHDPAMIRAARRHSPDGSYETAPLDALAPTHAADVVSAASLLCNLADPLDALRRLWSCVRPHGTLLVIETTCRMTPRHAWADARRHPAHRHPALLLWAAARAGRPVERTIFDAVPAGARRSLLLLDGMLEAIILTNTDDRET